VYIYLYFVVFILLVMFNYRLQCWSLLTIKHFDAFLEEKYDHVFFDSDY